VKLFAMWIWEMPLDLTLWVTRQDIGMRLLQTETNRSKSCLWVASARRGTHSMIRSARCALRRRHVRGLARTFEESLLLR
jgi:hypothetical protein